MNPAPSPSSVTWKLYLQCGFPSHNPSSFPFHSWAWQENKGAVVPSTWRWARTCRDQSQVTMTAHLRMGFLEAPQTLREICLREGTTEHTPRRTRCVPRCTCVHLSRKGSELEETLSMLYNVPRSLLPCAKSWGISMDEN